jgi:hypothetical protein
MPTKTQELRLREIPCLQCNLLTRVDVDHCLHCDATLELSSRARPSPRGGRKGNGAKGILDYASTREYPGNSVGEEQARGLFLE